MMTPNGMATRIVGISETWVMNQACSRNSSQEKRRAMMSLVCRTELDREEDQLAAGRDAGVEATLMSS